MERVKSFEKRKRRFRKEWLYCWIAVSLPIIGYIIFNAVPVGISLASMFTDIHHNQIGTMTWNNFAHFKTFFHDSKYWFSLGITLWLTCAQFVSLLVALIVATLLSAKVMGSRVFQTVFFVPYICATVALSIMWNWMFASGSNGVLNSLFGTQIDFRNSADWLTWCIFIVIAWSAPGYGIVMFTAAFVGVDKNLYEAAEIDGAGKITQYFKITLPQIAPMMVFLALAGWQAGFATFDAAKIMAPVTWTGEAGVKDMGLTVAYYSYIKGVSFSHMDYASVINWVTAAINFAGAFVFLRLRKRTEDNLE